MMVCVSFSFPKSNIFSLFCLKSVSPHHNLDGECSLPRIALCVYHPYSTIRIYHLELAENCIDATWYTLGQTIRAFYRAVQVYYPAEDIIAEGLAVLKAGVVFLQTVKSWWASGALYLPRAHMRHTDDRPSNDSDPQGEDYRHDRLWREGGNFVVHHTETIA